MKNKPAFIIAEISANHGQDLKRALSMIKKAKECGADAVKFQMYTPDTMTLDVDNKYFRIKHPKWGKETLYQLYRRAHMPWDWAEKIKKTADDLGIMFFATAFDKSSVDILENLNVPVHKIASFEITDLNLIEYAARTGKPLFISTGMSTVSEIREAVTIARRAGSGEVTLLKCVSSYPARPEEMNLRTIPDMARRFRCPVGISDHTRGIGVSLAAVAMGAGIIEKHFTLSREIETPDNFFSLEPEEFRDLADNVRITERALGKVYYGLTQDEQKSRVFRRSLFVSRDIGKGERITEENVRCVRPANGLLPKYFEKVIGKKTIRNLKKGTPLKWNAIGKNK